MQAPQRDQFFDPSREVIVYMYIWSLAPEVPMVGTSKC